MQGAPCYRNRILCAIENLCAIEDAYAMCLYIGVVVAVVFIIIVIIAMDVILVITLLMSSSGCNSYVWCRFYI